MPLKFVRDPLFHFFAIGLLLFGIDSLRSSGGDAAKLVYVPERVFEEVSQTFQTGFGRLPTPDELQPLIDTWVSNEVMYREAKSMQLDQGDEMIRERVIQKIRAMMASQIDVGEPTNEDLREFFEDHRDNYDQPVFYGFTFVRLSGGKDQAEAAAARWNQTNEDIVSSPGRRVTRFKLRPADNVAKLLGREIAASLPAMVVGQWEATQGPAGWAVLRLDRKIPAQKARLTDHLSDVRKRWSEWAAQREGARRVREMRAAYDIVVPEIPEAYVAEMPDQSAIRTPRVSASAESR